MTKVQTTFVLAAIAACLLSCDRKPVEPVFSDADAIALVQNYNLTVIEAYRTSDQELVEAVAGPAEATKLLGLIGVKRDMGLVLVSELQSFEVVGVRRPTGDVVVETVERWHYGEKRIGSGEQVGEESTDHYRMAYHLETFDGVWKVEKIEFVEPPKVGRTKLPIEASAAQMHGQKGAPDAAAPMPDAGPKSTPDSGP